MHSEFLCGIPALEQFLHIISRERPLVHSLLNQHADFFVEPDDVVLRPVQKQLISPGHHL